MKVKELKKMLKHVNPEADVLINVEGEEDYYVLDDIENSMKPSETEAIELYCVKTDKYVRKALFVQYDVYHPSLNKNWNENTRNELVESMSNFLISALNIDIEEANGISNKVLDEIASLSVEEVEERINRRECIGSIINRLVGEEIMPDILPPIDEK